jgi:hypothetical protein
MTSQARSLIGRCSATARAASRGVLVATVPAVVAVIFSVTNARDPAVVEQAAGPAASVVAPTRSAADLEPRQQIGEPKDQVAEPQQQLASVPVADPGSTDNQEQLGPTVGQLLVPEFDRGAPPSAEASMDVVNHYLWSVYERMPFKHDSSGDFTWKDFAAAQSLGMSLGDYVIRGMDADFRELLYRAGLAMDAAGIHWTILSAFRDDYRQSLAAGYKARTDNSLHGGSSATGGYGHGCAIDIVDADGHPDVVWKWLDANAAQVGLQRLLPGIDPAHVQPRGAWHELATVLRNDRLAPPPTPDDPATVVEPAAATAEPALPSAADLMCSGLRHRQEDPAQTQAGSGRRGFAAAARTRGGEKLAAAKGKWHAHGGVKLAAASSARDAKARGSASGPAAKLPSHVKNASHESRHAQHAVSHSAGAT